MSIIIKPIITEKITKEGEVFNRFGFVVDKKANKVQIKKAVEATYGISKLKSSSTIMFDSFALIEKADFLANLFTLLFNLKE